MHGGQTNPGDGHARRLLIRPPHRPL